MHYHFAEVHADSPQLCVSCKAALFQKSIEEFEHSWRADLEAERAEHGHLFELDLLSGELIVADFIEDGFHEQGNDVLVLGGDEHGDDAAEVQLGAVDALLGALEVPIEQRGRDEEALIGALERGQDFDHPVDHLGSVFDRYLVALEVGGLVLELLEALQVLVDRSAVLFEQVLLQRLLFFSERPCSNGELGELKLPRALRIEAFFRNDELPHVHSPDRAQTGHFVVLAEVLQRACLGGLLWHLQLMEIEVLSKLN